MPEMQSFHAMEELLHLRVQRKIARRQSYRRSRLARYRAELVRLRQAQASFAELALWLRKTKRIKVAPSTVMRYLNQLPELKKQEEHYAEFSQTEKTS